MTAVIFEVNLKPEQYDEYLKIAAQLKPLLLNIDGFISIERFTSMTEDNKILSLSFWRDEQAVKQWRNVEQHRRAQNKGRNSIFDGYRIRIADVERDYTLNDRHQTPDDSTDYHNKIRAN